MAAFVAPYTYVPDPTGDRAMFNGDAFFGMPNTDPTIPANQITVRKVEEDGSFTNISQPVQIGLGGVIIVDGAPAQIDIVENNYSVLMRDRNDVQRYSFPSAGPGGASGREVLLSQGGLPYDPTLITLAPTLVIDPLVHTNALILANTSANNITVNLPSAALTGDKFRFTIKKSTPDTNIVTIDPDGADRIDFQASLNIAEQFEALEISTDGSNWWTHSVFLRNAGNRLRAVETRSTTNQTNISTNAASLASLDSLPRVLAASRAIGNGTVQWSHNLSVTRTGTGTYTYAFTTPLLPAQADMYAANGNASFGGLVVIDTYSETGFRVRNFSFAGALQDGTISVNVIADPSVF